MGAAIEVRRLASSDTDLARQTICTLKNGGPPGNRCLGPADIRAWLRRPANLLVAATEGGIPVGYAIGYLLDRVNEACTMLFFYEVEVATSHRRRGIGKRLVEQMKTVAREERVVRMWVQTEPGNTPARSLYRDAGGVECPIPDLLYVWTHQTLNNRPSGS